MICLDIDMSRYDANKYFSFNLLLILDYFFDVEKQ